MSSYLVVLSMLIFLHKVVLIFTHFLKERKVTEYSGASSYVNVCMIEPLISLRYRQHVIRCPYDLAGRLISGQV